MNEFEEEEEESELYREASRGDSISPFDKIFTTQYTHFFLCGTSSWALNRVQYELKPIAFGTFTFLLGHGLLGLIKYTANETSKNKIRPLHRYSSFLTRTIPLPLISTQIYLDLKYSNLVAYSHVASSVVPIAALVFSHSEHIIDPLIKLVILSNAGSLAYVSYLNENYWALGFGTVALINEMLIDYIIDTLVTIPPIDWWTSALSIFVILAIKALDSV